MKKREIKFRYKELPKLLNQMCVIGKDGYLKLPQEGELPIYSFGLCGKAFALFDIKNKILIL